MTQGLEATRHAAGEGSPPGAGNERAASARPWWRPGLVVDGRYRLDRLLGEGGMGVVWAASHTLTGKPFALKFVKGGAVSGAVGVRLLREARIVSTLRHPNVVEVHDLIELDGGTPVMVMELLSGESLARRLLREPRMPLREVAAIFLPVISAVRTAHALRIVHRDLKPENIFLVDGSSARVKVLDFGIAKRTALEGQDAQTTGLTDSGTRLGTPCYMSPEQAFGEPIDHRTDIWSLGLLLYECLSGVLPTRADNAGQVFKIIVTGAISPLDRTAPHVPRELSSLVSRMLSTARDARLADLGEVVRVLEPLAQAAPPCLDAPAPPAAVRSEPPVMEPDRHAGEEGDGVDPMAATERTDIAARPAQRPSAGRRAGARAAAWTIGLGVALAGSLAGALALRGEPPPEVAAITVLPRSGPQAHGLYTAALQAARDAREAEAVDLLRQAVATDDAFAAAHLRLAIHAPELAEARKHHARAEALSAALDPDERAILAAMEPALGRDVADTALCAERLGALAAQHPDDAELLSLLARCALRSDIHASVAAARRIVEIEPHHARGWAALARSLQRLGSLNESAAAIDRCLAISPRAASCYEVRSELHSALGLCADVEHDLQLMLPAARGRGPQILRKLASSIHAQGRSPDAVRELTRQSRVSLPEAERRHVSLLDEANLSAFMGNFAAAEDQLRRARLWISADSRAHADVARALIDIALETDRALEAASIAETCVENYSACATGSADLLRVMRHAGLLTRAEFQRRRAEQLSPSRAPGAADLAPSAWMRAHARWIGDPEEAAEDAPALPLAALMSHQVGHEVHADIGAVYHLAGMPHHAIYALRRAVTTCDGLGWPVRYVRSFWFLGQALEQTRDVPGACEAYASVIARWGSAAPRSVTAERARARMTALGCGTIG
ncbi:uncharacterized protein SOCEGT47_030740 [Sorangium cellulosum]|uniref:Protein kinase domain-containing protein n=1 Tax=Sorangium cellulosum TaxID=56 RepID=A0A4P2Q0A4_SORCE|nr:serine/threonine-protein kinase [Sorangium cellulosum]AUX22570.1 uncharacterized protein SOCEGT47_030740 [Sorangium cellulosum]